MTDGNDLLVGVLTPSEYENCRICLDVMLQELMAEICIDVRFCSFSTRLSH